MNRTICASKAKRSDSRLLYENTQIVYQATEFGLMNRNILYNNPVHIYLL